MIELMIYLIVLVALVSNSVMTYFIFRSFRSIILSFPLWVSYYWMLHGSLSLIEIHSTQSRHYIEFILYPVEINSLYLTSCLIYLICLLFYSLIIAIYVFSSRAGRSVLPLSINEEINKMKFNYATLFVSILFVVFSTLIAEDIYQGVSQGVSAYYIKQQSALGYYRPIAQFLGDTCIYSVTILIILGLATNWANQNGAIRWVLSVQLIGLFVINLLVGNRHILVSTMALFAVLFIELIGLSKKKILKILPLLGLGSVVIVLTGILRGEALENLLVATLTFEDFWNGVLYMGDSAEKYAAHMSLYAILDKDIPVTWGDGVMAFFSSLMPGIFGFSRSPSLYEYYISSLGVISDQGFTINHFSGWYLDFGYFGLIIGVILWASLSIGFYHNYCFRTNLKNLLIAALFSISSLHSIRSPGIESYKATLILSTLIPALLLCMFLRASVTKTSTKQRR